MLLEVRGMSVQYGNVHAVRDGALKVSRGEVVAVVGANGAGKSSLLKAILGLTKARSDRLCMDGKDIARKSTAARVAGGLGLVPEGRRIVTSLTVEENLLLGTSGRRDSAAVRQEIDGLYGRFSNLARHRHSSAAVLSGGEQQMLAIGRALLARPTLLMLDEPSLGLSPLLVQQLFTFLAEVRLGGTAMLLVEQNTRMALQLASRAYVMELGRFTLSGDSGVLRQDERLISAYLGSNETAAATD